MMDIETERILDLLFRKRLPGFRRTNSDFYNYLVKIGGYDIDMLIKEPNHLVDEQITVQLNIQNLVFSNYKIFMHVAENSKEIFTEFNDTEIKIDKLLEMIPKFMDTCNFFCKIANDISNRKKINNLTLNKNSELQEILELPHLMDSCLKNNQYSEALELCGYAKLLSIRHNDIEMITKIVNNIESSWSSMINQIVDLLIKDLSLPKCLQFVGLLRSMGVFTESELRIKFIEAREIWLKELLKIISSSDYNTHLIKTIEILRIHLFNMIMQYKALFSDGYLEIEKGTVISNSTIFYQWLEEQVSQFLKTLNEDLYSVSSIDSILGQCKYFGLSFGRVGTDFTGRMSYIFIKIIKLKFEHSVSKSTKLFAKSLESFTFAYAYQKLSIKIESAINSENPPEKLVDYYPLAEYCNSLIAIFNELRLNTSIVFVQAFTSLLQNSLHSVAKTMFSFYENWKKNFTPSDRESMVKFTECFWEQLIPYIQHCIHALFPPNQVAMYLNISINQLEKEEISFLQKEYIVEPVKPLLSMKTIPVKMLSSEAISSNDSIDLNSSK